VYQQNPYDLDPHIAEIYDQLEHDDSDIDQIRQLIGSRSPQRILEPFCGTGRIAISLGNHGHQIVGMDNAKGMLERAAYKIGLTSGLGFKVELIEKDVLQGSWPSGFDLVILGRNCFYELPTQHDQEKCFEFANKALKKGGHIYVDNNHMEGGLDQAWQDLTIVKTVLAGKCEDGTIVDGKMQTIWFDSAKRLVRLKRQFNVEHSSGKVVAYEFIQQKHPVSAVEVRGWLAGHGFEINHQFGDYESNVYQPSSPRAIFWAQKVN
jgi:SAM-dependent methyltransferase